jgi:hypothetical protein
MPPSELQIGQLLFSMLLLAVEALGVNDGMVESSSIHRFVFRSWPIISHSLCEVG